jgi:hypothetical protein
MQEETRHEKFQRLATKRTNQVLHDLRLIGNLSSKSNYDYIEEEVEKMFSVIRKQLNTVQAKFRETREEKFKL